MLSRFHPAERVLITAILADLCTATPIVTLGFLSGAATAASEAVRNILLVGIDVFSLGVLLAVNRRKFTRFEFGIEKIQILVQICVAFGMFASILFIGNKIYLAMTEEATLPDYGYSVLFALICYINVLNNSFNLRRMIQQERRTPSLIVRGQIKNRLIMLVSSVVATLSSGAIILADPKLFDLIDGVGAVIVLCIIIYVMVRLLHSGVLTLLDAPIDEKDKLLVFREIVEHFHRWDNIAFVRTRRVGYSRYIEVGLSFDKGLLLDAALATCRDIESGIRQRLGNAFVRVIPVRGTAAEITRAD